MRTVQLSPHLPAHESESAERTEETAIESEIAARLLELREKTSASRAAEFVTKLASLHQIRHTAFWTVVEIMSGDLSAITTSYAEQGKARGIAKQAVQQELERTLESIGTSYPEVAQTIIRIRCITADIKKPESNT